MNKHIGPTLESLFDELGEREAFEARAVKKMVALQLRARMEAAGITPAGLAHAMKTSRAAVGRLLDPANESMTLETLTRAARAIRADVLVCLIDKAAVRAPRKTTAVGKRRGTPTGRPSRSPLRPAPPRFV